MLNSAQAKPSARALGRILGCQPEDLPTLPATAMQLNKLASDDKASVQDLAQVINRDPPLAATLLKVANSPFFKPQEPVTEVGRAVVILGFKEVCNLALGLTILASSGGLGPLKRRIQRQDLWRHSLVTGLLTDLLAREDLGLGSGHYIHGLLHDLGKVALDAFRSEDVGRLLAAIEKEQRDWNSLEDEITGVDHGFVGQMILDYWDLPLDLVTAVGLHHRPWEAGPHQDQAGLVCLANYLARRMGYHSFAGESGLEDDPTVMEPMQAFFAKRGWDPERILKTRIEQGLEQTLASVQAIGI
ncbi:MAG: HDOD domain-containing protein [Desulfarculaceae bacterium]|jgi:HD-like signal output (HDOD) protein